LHAVNRLFFIVVSLVGISTLFSPITVFADSCADLLAGVRSEELHKSSTYWEIDPAKSETISQTLSREVSSADRALFASHRARPLDPKLKAEIEADQQQEPLLDPIQYIERHFSRKVFEYLRQNPEVKIVIAPGDFDEVASYLRGAGAR
jgi:hypothetical protein